MLFENQKKEDLKNAVLRMENEYKKFIPQEIRKHAQKFNEKAFIKEIRDFINEKLQDEIT